MSEWDDVIAVLVGVNAALYTAMAGVAAALVLFHIGDHVVLRITKWRFGGRCPRSVVAAFDLRDLHVLRMCNDVGQPWEDCKAHIARFLAVPGDDAVTVVCDESSGRILGAHTRGDRVVFTTAFGRARLAGSIQRVMVLLPGGDVDLGHMRDRLTGHSLGTIDALDCERLRALIARHRDRETRIH
jgi:hypothetical protein